MRRNVAAGIGSNEQGEYCRAAMQRSDRKEPRYKWPTLLYFNMTRTSGNQLAGLAQDERIHHVVGLGCVVKKDHRSAQ